MNHETIRAVFDETTITVYQAFNVGIAESAVKHQKFISPGFKLERMTWIKPSFLWMMYRSGWATKTNQERILAIKITRTGFEWALRNSCLSHFDEKKYSSKDEWKGLIKNTSVRIQWDPERDINLQPLNYRSIQMGLSGIALTKYVSEWISEIQDITEYCNAVHSLVIDGNIKDAIKSLPNENIYPFDYRNSY